LTIGIVLIALVVLGGSAAFLVSTQRKPAAIPPAAAGRSTAEHPAVESTQPPNETAPKSEQPADKSTQPSNEKAASGTTQAETSPITIRWETNGLVINYHVAQAPDLKADETAALFILLSRTNGPTLDRETILRAGS
jgi:cytoskeletal protein RodZ